MVKRVVCPDCGGEYQRIAIHWNAEGVDCRWPVLSPTQREIALGLMMGDGGMSMANGESPYLQVTNTNLKFLEWLENQFGPLSKSITNHSTAQRSAERALKRGRGSWDSEDYKDCYWWSVRPHPELQHYTSWYDSGSKKFPESLKLTPMAMKVWFCSDWYVKEGKAAFDTRNEQYSEELFTKIFNEIGIAPYFDNGYSNRLRIVLNSFYTYCLYRYMGEPLPGFEYKWPKDDWMQGNS